MDEQQDEISTERSARANAVEADQVHVDLLLETGGGGAGRHVLDLYFGLRSVGWNARVLLSSRRMETTFRKEIAELPSEHVTYLDLRRSPHPSDLLAMSKIRRYISQSRGIHILHAHSTKGGIIGWGVGGPKACRVLTPHAYRGMDATLSPLSARAIRAAEKVFTRAYDSVIAVSPDEKKYIESLGAPPEDVQYIPNGVDVEKISRIAGATRSRRSTNDSPVIGFVGRLAYQKNPEFFLQVLRALHDACVPARAIIVGEGSLRASLHAMAETLGLASAIEWRGNVPAIAELGKMDVLLHTSHYESFPYVLLEAAAASLPVLSVENAGSRAIFGEMVPEAILPGFEANTFSAKIRSLLGNPAERDSHGAKCRRVADTFSLTRMVEQTVEIYRKVLARSKAYRALRPSA